MRLINAEPIEKSIAEWKAILILNEMPSKCGDCPLLQQWYDDEYEKWRYMCFWRYCKIEDTERKLNVCPLKPMPSREDIHEEIYQAYGLGKEEPYERMRDAVDKVLDEILGAEEHE